MDASSEPARKMVVSLELVDRMIVSRHRHLVSNLEDTRLASVRVAGVSKVLSPVVPSPVVLEASVPKALSLESALPVLVGAMCFVLCIALLLQKMAATSKTADKMAAASEATDKMAVAPEVADKMVATSFFTEYFYFTLVIFNIVTTLIPTSDLSFISVFKDMKYAILLNIVGTQN